MKNISQTVPLILVLFLVFPIISIAAPSPLSVSESIAADSPEAVPEEATLPGAEGTAPQGSPRV